MKRSVTGRYEIRTVGGERIEAFVPNPLPPRPPIEIKGKLQRSLEPALVALGRLDSLSTLLPDTTLFLYAYIRKEAILSSQIEGTQSSLSDLLLFELNEAPGVPIDDVVEVSNYVAALEHGLQRLRDGFPLSNRLIREIHEILLSRGRGSEKSPGEFRRSQNWIGGTRPGNAAFVPPPPELVATCMGDFEAFLHDAHTDLPVLVKAGLAHVQFETIHPFLDGNGRVGRLLITLLLCHAGILREPLLYLSLYFKQNRSTYYTLLDAVRREGNWETWLSFFLEGVQQTAQGAVDTARRLVDLFREDRERVISYARRANSVLRIYDAVKARPITSLSEVRRSTGISFPTAARGMEVLTKLGIVQEITGKARNRVYVYGRYVAILNEGTER